MDPYRALKRALFIILVIVLGATGAYSAIEGWSLFDSLYMVMITVSTVGYREVRPLSPAGRVVTLILIVLGISAITYTVTSVTRLLVEGELRRVLGRRRMERDIEELEDHFIVCGYGRVGRVVCQELAEEGVPLVVVDREESPVEHLERDGHLYVRGDATEEVILEAAGIDRAQGLVLTLPHEADNVYVCLLAKDLREDLFVLARSITDNGERRLRAAGADRVVSPNQLGGHRMAQTVLRPTVMEFMEIVTARDHLQLQIDELRIREGSELAGRTLAECEIRRRFGLIVVGILKRDGSMLYNPEPDDRITAGSTVIVLGRRESLDRFGESLA